MQKYAKLWAALAAAVAVGVSVTVDGSLSLNDGFAIASALLGSFGVYAVTNTLPPDSPTFAPPRDRRFDTDTPGRLPDG